MNCHTWLWECITNLNAHLLALLSIWQDWLSLKRKDNSKPPTREYSVTRAGMIRLDLNYCTVQKQVERPLEK